MLLQPGDKIEYLGGAIKEQALWAGTDFPSSLIVGYHYTIDTVEVYPSYTRVTLRNKAGTFNSVHFRLV